MNALGLTGVALLLGGAVAFVFAPVLPMGESGQYNSVMDQIQYSNANLVGILSYSGNAVLYGFIMMMVAGAALIFVGR